MNELELRRIRKADKKLGMICVEAKKQGKSYGQLQAERYEKQQKLGVLLDRIENEFADDTKPPVKKYPGKAGKPKPEGWEEIAMMVVNGEMSKSAAAPILHVTPPTLTKWIDELLRNGESC